MKTYTYRLAGEECSVYFPEHPEDLDAFRAWVASAPRVVALDTETTGLGIYRPGFRTRLVQMGDRTTAWVLRVDRFAYEIAEALASLPRFVIHNAAFDAQVLGRCGLADMDALLAKTFDTRLLAHLIDPRGREEGGTGLGLKDLSAVYVDASAPDTAKDLHEVFRRDYKTTIAEGWSVIDVDHPTYVLYAGLDVLIGRRLFDVLAPEVKARGLSRLATFEHEVQAVVCRMMRRGMKLDVAYTERLAEDLQTKAAEAAKRAAVFGVANVNAPRQVAAALTGMGWEPTEWTPSGQAKVDKAVLAALADAGNPLAVAVHDSKRATKWRESYAIAMLEGRDGRDRIHPDIASLQARTARMSISRPPLQQLPSGDWTIRRCLVADEGEVIGGVDYKAVEMRVLAALADEKKMKAAIADGVDLHDFTATLIYGPEFTKAQRKLAKMTGFGKVYGGGATTLARQTGADMGAVKHAIEAYDRAFPGIKRYARRLQERAMFGAREVVTPTGRVLPLDRDRLYSATNYVVQSTARDLLAQALTDLEEAGLGEHLLLPVHDEVIFQAPKADAEEVAHEIARVMGSDFFGVAIEADPEVYGPTWGHGYGYKEGMAA